MLKGAASAFDVSTTVSGLSLDSYVQMYKALNKTSPVNECYFKVQDLRQVGNRSIYQGYAAEM